MQSGDETSLSELLSLTFPQVLENKHLRLQAMSMNNVIAFQLLYFSQTDYLTRIFYPIAIFFQEEDCTRVMVCLHLIH